MSLSTHTPDKTFLATLTPATDQEIKSSKEHVANMALSVIKSTTNSIPKGLVYIDHVLDLVPFVATATKALDLVLKHLALNNIYPESSYFKDFIVHLQNKDSKKCMAFGIPFVGTVAKIGTVAYNFFATTQKTQEDYVIINQKDILGDDFIGMSTIGMRLQKEEEAQMQGIVYEFYGDIKK
jgi:hypothetical protein